MGFNLESGLHYNWHRHYDPSTGRYLQPDPLGMPDGPSRYAYAVNSPQIAVDPDGRFVIALPFVAGVSGKFISGVLGAATGTAIAAIIFNKDENPAENEEENSCPIPEGGLSDDDLVCRGGTCEADQFLKGTGVTLNPDGTLKGISTQARPGAKVDELSRPFKNGQVGVTNAGKIREAGGNVVRDGDRRNPNHATVGGITPRQAEKLFTPTRANPVPKGERGR